MKIKLDSTLISKIARNSLMQDLYNALVISFFNAQKDIDSLQENIFIKNATEEVIKQWETFMGLQERKDYTMQDREDRIIYTLRTKGIFTKEFLKSQAKIFTNGEIEIKENFKEYSFEIVFTNIVGQPPNIENFRNMVDLNKPAHLTYELVFRYNTHGELAQHKLTHEQLKRYTHQQIYNTRVFEDRRS